MNLDNSGPTVHRPPGLVLVVDDEAPIALALAEVVEEAGYRVVLAYHGQEALEMVHQYQPALIFTDLMMPQLNGRELIATLRAQQHIPQQSFPAIILMTAAGRVNIRDVGADAVLLKPFELEEVEALLHRFLADSPDE